jgi:hypothetical protein
MSVHAVNSTGIISIVPYYVRLRKEADLEPIMRARTSFEAVREFVTRRHCPDGAVVEVFTPQMIREGKRPFVHRLKEYRRPRI